MKSSRIIVSVKHLKMKASFQKGFMPSGIEVEKTAVTEQMSTMMKARERSIATRRIPKRGDTLINSMIPNSYRRTML